MKINEKILSLVKHGLKATNLTKLNESQIDSLYSRLVSKKTKLSEAVTKQTTTTTYTDAELQKGVPGGSIVKKNTDGTTTITKEGEINEKSVSKKQHGLMGAAYSVEKGDKELKDIPKSYRGKVEKVVDSMSKKQIKDFAKTKTKNLPKEVNEDEKYDLSDALEKHASNYFTKFAEKSVPRIKSIGESELEKEIISLVEKHLSPKMTKRDFINVIESTLTESPTIAPERERTKEKEEEKKKREHDKNDPFRPGKRIQPKPAPKAKKEMKESPEVAPAPVKVPEREKEKTPDKNDPFRPGKRIQPKPAPKAKVPEWLSSKSLGI